MRVLGGLCMLVGLGLMAASIVFIQAALRGEISVLPIDPSDGVIAARMAAHALAQALAQPWLLAGGFLFVGGAAIFAGGHVAAALGRQGQKVVG